MDILFKRGTRTATDNYVGLKGEIVVDNEQYTLNYCDGITVGGHQIVTEKIRPIKLNTDYNDKTLKDLKQYILDVFNCPGYNQKSFSVSVSANFVSNWNARNDDWIIEDGTTWTFQLLTEVNGYQKHYFQFLASTYSSQSVLNDSIDSSSIIYSCDVWNGEFGLVKRIESSIMNWSNNLWCRQYTNGFMFIGGRAVSNNKNVVITLPVSFINPNCTIVTSQSASISNKTSTSFTINSSGTSDFMLYGY